MIETKKPSRRQSKTLPNFKIDDKFLYEHLRDTRAEMTWRRELEFRLMQFMLIFYPILGTAVIELFRNNSIGALTFSVVALAAIALIVIATNIVTDRIDHEHETYVDLGRQVQLIWFYFGLFEKGAYLPNQAFLPEKLLDEKTSLGTGPGYKKTKTLIRITSLTLIVLLMILTGIKIFAAREGILWKNGSNKKKSIREKSFPFGVDRLLWITGKLPSGSTSGTQAALGLSL